MHCHRLGIVVTHPIQYQVPLFRQLAAHPSIDLSVFFTTNHGVVPSYDQGFGRDVKYDIPLLDGYRYEFVSNWSLRPSPSTPLGAINPRLPGAILRAHLDALLVHGWSNLSAWIAYLAAAASGTHYLIRGDSQPDSPSLSWKKALPKRAIVGTLIRNASGCLAIGSRNREFYRLYGARPSQIFDAPYSVDTARFSDAAMRARLQRTERLATLGLNPTRPLVLFSAKLQPWKRPFDVIDALDLLDGCANLVVVGDGPLRAEIEDRARTRPWMSVLGFVNQTQIADWYGISDIFVLPSEREPWGLAVNEAMAAGTIPIVSDAVGCSDDLVTPDIGFIFPTADIAALAHAIDTACRITDLPLRRATIRSRAERWGLDATVRGVVTALETIAIQ